MLDKIRNEADNLVYTAVAIFVIFLGMFISGDSPAAAMAQALFGALLIKVKGGASQ